MPPWSSVTVLAAAAYAIRQSQRILSALLRPPDWESSNIFTGGRWQTATALILCRFCSYIHHYITEYLQKHIITQLTHLWLASPKHSPEKDANVAECAASELFMLLNTHQEKSASKARAWQKRKATTNCISMEAPVTITNCSKQK